MKRRSLFKVGAVSAFAISSTAAHALTLNPSQKWDGEYDVIIVGAGGAGLGCAIETTDRKLKTLILEKMPFVGGASAICAVNTLPLTRLIRSNAESRTMMNIS